MISPSPNLQSLPGSDVELLFSPGALSSLPDLAHKLHSSRILLVTDPGIRDSGHVDRAVRALYHAGLVVRVFDQTQENPTSTTVNACLLAARPFKPDLIVGLGGGSSMDTAKGANFLLTNGGAMKDYHGSGKAKEPMLPMIAIPTTAGTGSEAQSYALISDPETHTKMACGDKKALPRYAILDPDLVATCPPKVAAATGIDAIAHAVETAASTRRTDTSRHFSREAWRLLESSFIPSLNGRVGLAPPSSSPLANMLLGAHLSGCAIENAMLGAAHAAANPLTAHYGTPHGHAVGLMLPHVVRFNAESGDNPYADLMPDVHDLVNRLTQLLSSAHLPQRLRDLDIPASDLPTLAREAAQQWTATFNPRPVQEQDLLEIYRRAL